VNVEKCDYCKDPAVHVETKGVYPHKYVSKVCQHHFDKCTDMEHDMEMEARAAR
jgi:hypothetical protein